MRAILEFALPDDRDGFAAACAAEALRSALLDIREALRQRRKYGDPEESSQLDWTWETVHRIIAEHDLNGVMGLS